MIEVEVRNFQSIEKAAFRIDGFTVIVGRSNIGKSALVRAMKAALTGAPASSFVRHGAACPRRTKKAKTCKCFASVHMVGDGFDLLWEKGDAINRYTYNGQVYDKAERGTPDFLQPDFSPVKVGDRQEVLQVSDQFNPIFLLDQTGGSVADTLSDVARLDRINAAMRLSERDRKEAVSTRKVREKDVADLRVKLTTYDGLDAVLADAQAIADRHVAVEKQERVLQRVDEFLGQLSSLAGVVRELGKVTAIVIPDPWTLRAEEERFDALDEFLARKLAREQEIANLSGVEDVQVPSAVALGDASKALARLDGWVAKLVEMKGWLGPWKAVEAAPVPEARKLTEARDRLTAIDALLTKHTNLMALVKSLDDELAVVLTEETAIKAEQDELGVCPTCARSVAECGGVE